MDKTIKLWSIETKKEIATLIGHMESVNSISFNNNGKMLASGSDDSIILWDLEINEKKGIF